MERHRVGGISSRSPSVLRSGAASVLLVEDDPHVRSAVASYLRHQGLEVREAGSLADARTRLLEGEFDVVLVDHILPDGDSLQVLAEVRARAPDTAVIVLTGHGTVDLAVRAVKLGADDMITKPVSMALVLERIGDVVGTRRATATARSATRRVLRDSGSLRRLATEEPDLAAVLVGDSPAMRSLHAQIRAVRDADCPVLILGETGTGKGVVARALHRVSARRDRPFVDLNCAVLSREFVESELFGHVRGAFTGAHANKQGLFEAAHGGTLFLDEIGDIDPAVQPKLLTAIEERRFRRMGEVQDRSVDVRLLAATHHDLLGGRGFRGDLYYRISTISIDVPPLRSRGSDVVLLARSFLDAACEKFHRDPLHLDPGAERALSAHRWPGNVRELRNVMERAAVVTSGSVVTERDLRFDQPATPAQSSPQSTLEDVERRHVESVLADEGWDVARAARRLGIARSTLYLKIKSYGLRPGPR